MSALAPAAKKKTKKRAERRAAMESPWTLAPLETARELSRSLASARSDVVVGVNAVTRHLERGAARLACVCDDAEPRRIIEHVVELCLRLQVPVVVLPKGASTVLSRGLGTKRCLAFGVKVKAPRDGEEADAAPVNEALEDLACELDGEE